jgi:hypothetical protein
MSPEMVEAAEVGEAAFQFTDSAQPLGLTHVSHLAVDEHAPVLADQLLAAYGSGNLPEMFGFAAQDVEPVQYSLLIERDLSDRPRPFDTFNIRARESLPSLRRVGPRRSLHQRLRQSQNRRRSSRTNLLPPQPSCFSSEADSSSRGCGSTVDCRCLRSRFLSGLTRQASLSSSTQDIDD